MKKNKKNKQDTFFRKFTQEIFNPRTNKRIAFSNFKENETLQKIITVTDKLSKRYKVFDKYFMFDPFPTSYNDLRQLDFLYLTDHIDKEINWLIVAIRREKDKLNYFLRLKEKYEKELLLGDYKNARKTIDTIENEISLSIWGMENKFLLNEYEFGLEKNKNLLSEIHSDTNNPAISLLSYYLSDKAEINLTIFRYIDEINRFLRDFKNNDDLKEYFKFQIRFAI